MGVSCVGVFDQTMSCSEKVVLLFVIIALTTIRSSSAESFNVTAHKIWTTSSVVSGRLFAFILGRDEKTGFQYALSTDLCYGFSPIVEGDTVYNTVLSKYSMESVDNITIGWRPGNKEDFKVCPQKISMTNDRLSCIWTSKDGGKCSYYKSSEDFMDRVYTEKDCQKVRK